MSEPAPPTPAPETTPAPALVFHPKTTAAGLGGSLTLVIVYLLQTLFGVTPPPEVAVAMTTIVGTAFAWAAPRVKDELGG